MEFKRDLKTLNSKTGQKKAIRDFAGKYPVKFLRNGVISCDFTGKGEHDHWCRQEFYSPASFFEFFANKIYPELN